MLFSLWTFVYIAAAVQAGLLGLALWRRAANREANRLLAVWVGLTGIDLAVKAMFWHLLTPEWFRAYRFVALFPFLYGSLFYLYVRALTQGMLALNSHVLTMDEAGLRAMVARWLAGERTIGAWFDLPLFLYSLSYVVAALVLVRTYRQRLRQRRSDADRLSLRWINAMAGFQIAIWCLAIVQALFYLPVLNYGLLFGLIAAWVCVVGWFSLGQPPVQDESASAQIASADDDAPTPIDSSRYAEVEARLAQLMAGETPLYLEPALTIGQVARRSGYPEYLVSTVINRRLGGSFWDYVNRLRVEAVRERLGDPAETRTILDLAYACGFTSKSTFNAAFKRQVGETPSGYRRRLAAATGSMA
ncbi:MAG: AraC family transcriptional regulator [Rhodanobacter sp. SCN 68-63]|nr:MAG: AraC family transcriptional regulator [Rhodanobacter sp. SCN 68-63]